MGVVKITGEPTAPSAPQVIADDSTRDRILELLLTHGGRTASELAQTLQLTATGIRRHLGLLVDAGLIAESTEQVDEPRGRGRPAKSYRLTAAGRQRFGEHYDDLALSALAELVAAVGPDALDRLAANQLRAVETDYRARRAADPDGDQLEQLAEALSAAGYFASSPDDGELCQHHCPVAHVAERFPQLCEAETVIFSRLLGTDLSRSATIAHGDTACRTHLGMPNPVSPSADRKVSA